MMVQCKNKKSLLKTNEMLMFHLTITQRKEIKKKLFNDTLKHFIYGYMASDIW